MKKVLTAIAFSVIMLVGCMKENDSTVSEKQPFKSATVFSFKASVEDISTKGSFNDVGKYSWSSGDAIGMVLQGEGDYNPWVAKFTFDGSDTFNLDQGDLVLGDDVYYGKFAFYPYGTNSTETNYVNETDKLYVYLPATREYTSETMPIPLAANLGDEKNPSTITMKHIAAGIQIQLTKVPAEVTSISLTVEGQNISGWYVIDGASVGSSAIAYTNDGSGSDTMSYNVTNPSETMLLTYPVPELTSPKLTINAYVGSTLVFSKTSKAQPSISKGQILVMPSVQVDTYNLFVLDDGLAKNGSAWSGSRTIWSSEDVTSAGTSTFGSYSYNRFILPRADVGKKIDIYYKGGNYCEVKIPEVTISEGIHSYYFKTDGIDVISVSDPESPSAIPTRNPSIWVASSISNLYCHMWGGDSDTVWPGKSFTASTSKYNGDPLYYVEIIPGTTKYVLNHEVSSGNRKQTADCALSDASKSYYFTVYYYNEDYHIESISFE